MRAASGLAAVLLLTACGQDELVADRPAEAPDDATAASSDLMSPDVTDWRQIASDGDEARMSVVDSSWVTALDQARADGFTEAIDHGGADLDPGAGIRTRQVPSPGEYACRTYKLGYPAGGAGVSYVTYPDFECVVERPERTVTTVTKLTGSQRSHGRIFVGDPDGPVFIGTQAWGDENGFPAYGQHRERDQIGRVERIGANTWRIVFPQPAVESHLDVMVLEQKL